MTTHEIADIAAKQIRGKIVDLTGISLDHRDDWMERIIEAAIEKYMAQSIKEMDNEKARVL